MRAPVEACRLLDVARDAVSGCGFVAGVTSWRFATEVSGSLARRRERVRAGSATGMEARATVRALDRAVAFGVAFGVDLAARGVGGSVGMSAGCTAAAARRLRPAFVVELAAWAVAAPEAAGGVTGCAVFTSFLSFRSFFASLTFMDVARVADVGTFANSRPALSLPSLSPRGAAGVVETATLREAAGVARGACFTGEAATGAVAGVAFGWAVALVALRLARGAAAVG